MDLKDLNNTRDFTAQMDPKDVTDNKVMAVLAYLSWLILIPIFLAKESKFARFHVNQAIILVVASFLTSIIAGIVTSILWPLALVFWLISLCFFALMILGIINAAQGKAKELPIFGKFRILK
ncbi:MAG: hypothetical protein E7467_05950 [Ruminococcaceae bacterium]|nr:hypothetical protein [Oscillospiraceae bacterium]